jgi:bifunctional DNA-binding transcriptional regulator/antitoxin component of YhaV-PrlF toxin-antitoxin module
MESGIVYILSNSAMPGIYKIGITTRNDIKSRIRELYTTSVPVPFECEYACKVEDCKKVESAIHYAFDPERINPQREFFRTDPDRVIAILKLLEKEDITKIINNDVNKDIDKIDLEASNKLKKSRRPPLNFKEMGIAIGDELEFLDEDHHIIVKVKSEKTVEFEGKEYSLTKLTQELLQLDYAIQPTKKWAYKGKNLSDIYNEIYQSNYE